MTHLQIALLALLSLGILWAAYKIGKFLLRLVLGLAVLAAAAYGLWRILQP